MFGTRFLFFSVLLFYSRFGDGVNVGKSEITDDLKKGNTRTDAEQDPFTSITDDFKKGNTRTDAEQDPFTSVTLAARPGDPQSKLFSTCIATSQTLEAKFTSIEVVAGSEYIRYVPDSFQLSFPLPWKTLNGSYSSILDCAQAVHDAGWSMFKYNGAKCEATSMIYDLNDVPKCEGNNSDAVFILSSAIVDCGLPKFFLGYDNKDKAICGLVSEVLMTHAEAKNFCLNAYPDQELSLFVNEYPPLTLQNVSHTFTELGYKKTNLWVDAEQIGNVTDDAWYGDFTLSDWWNGKFPVASGPPFRVAYMDKDSNFKLRATDKSFKAGALCATTAVSGIKG